MKLTIRKVGVIGAGQMGNGIAHVFAQAGWNVAMIDVSPEALKKGRDTIASNLDRQIKKGTLPAAEKDGILSRVELNTSLKAARLADLVVEAATENPEIKFKLFAELDLIAKTSAVLATNTRPSEGQGLAYKRP